jgi:hypothetical protein
MAVTVCTECLAVEAAAPFPRCVCGAAYCGPACQRAAWPLHRPTCPAMVARPVAGRGRGMVATRRARPGDLLATEPPLLLVTDAYRAGGRERLAAALEGLGPGRRAELLALHDPGLGSGVPGEPGEGEAGRAWRVLYANGISVGLEEEQLHAVYATLSRINHSCRANTFQRCSGQARTLAFFASREIQKGEEITLNYLGPTAVLLPREERRAQLEKGWFFHCSCHLCSLEGDQLLLSESIRTMLASFKDEMLHVTNPSPRDYTGGQAEARAAAEEEKQRAEVVGQVARHVVATLGPRAVPALQLELESIYYTFKHNLSDISYYL